MKHPVGYHSQIDYVLHRDLGPSEVMRSVGRIHSGPDDRVREEEARGLRRTVVALGAAVVILVGANFMPHDPPANPQTLTEHCHEQARRQADEAHIHDALTIMALVNQCEVSGGF